MTYTRPLPFDLTATLPLDLNSAGARTHTYTQTISHTHASTHMHTHARTRTHGTAGGGGHARGSTRAHGVHRLFPSSSPAANAGLFKSTLNPKPHPESDPKNGMHGLKHGLEHMALSALFPPPLERLVSSSPAAAPALCVHAFELNPKSESRGNHALSAMPSAPCPQPAMPSARHAPCSSPLL